MDPWGNRQDAETNLDFAQNQQFEDNFQPQLDKLPDSDKYIQILEAKLDRIKNDPDTLKQLKEKREACLQNLLNSDRVIDDDTDDLETPIENLELYRKIVPQKQALNRGEIVELIQYDQLENSD